ncbi:DHA2 family efflux MFS transporter permease subunit [Pseudonocardia sp. WMMC193]|uniref:DHA2 family efflux MFS transporter permease subunit n=1 Tax=Pseudonocardia sp. WMMC193 TaxID=2911965 RepID=UPI001F0273C8|nr:DHA2 family efflux MFS transporter permease subunit [Pseudonocardia sp. WMMC193]MCF7551295.1 DHA2 family efflux MFS transporter permease subunit [Pseudonocardia sp. WMMC193]
MAVTESSPQVAEERSPWPALWALVVGFFMILVDSTIVTVATPAIQAELGASVDGVVWVTSSFLLAYAVPLLITGRLGDRFGPRRVYLVGLVLFTLASLWCGLTGSIAWLVVARVFQGLGASMMTPQTMAVITRTFPPDQRGRAMSLWGAVAGVATLVGPILGGVLVDGLGWEWIFFINVPVGAVAVVLALRLVPELPTSVHRFDLLGVALSALGMFLLVFGIQEGQSNDWAPGIWGMILSGLAVLAVFVWWQSRNRGEPLMSLSLFRDRNFTLANIAITTVGFAVIAMTFPLFFYAQGVLGLSPTRSALLLIPMAVLSGALAPFVGRLTDRAHPRWIAGFGMLAWAASLGWLALVMEPGVAIWHLLLPIGLLGVGNAFVWGPVATTANRNLPLRQAGAGAGVYNTTRQVGAVLGSAGIAVFMESRIAAHLGVGGAPRGESVAALPPALHGPFTTAMAEALLLPAGVLLVGLVAVLSFTVSLRPDRGQ